jgi:integrase
MIIRGFCTWLVEKKKLRFNPAEFIQTRCMTSAKGRPFCRREQVDELIVGSPDNDLKFIQFAGFHAGLRKEEIIQARPEWFDLRLNIITIVESEDWKPKDKDKRSIPLSKAFRKFLVEEMCVNGELPGPFLLKPEKVQGKARYRYDFRKPFEEYVRSKKLDWVKPHVMRHTFASLLAIAGVSIFKIAKWLGDDVRVVERHYAHLLPQDPDVERAFGDAGPEQQSAKEPGIDQAL